MKLMKFKVENFRSINDSGDIEVEHITALVGRNESGKTNLLLALASLKPPGGIQPLHPIKDFPRSRRLQECKDNTPVVSSTWELTAAETEEISKRLGEDQQIKTVGIGRYYEASYWVDLHGATRPTIQEQSIKKVLRKIEPLLTALAEKVADEKKRKNITEAVTHLIATNEKLANSKEWAEAFSAATKAVRQRIGEASLVPDDAIDDPLAELEEQAQAINSYDAKHAEVRKLVVQWLPTFVYTPEFPELPGHQNLDQFVNHRGNVAALKDSEDNFEKLAKVADFDPRNLHANMNDHEMRGQILNRAGALVTGEVRRLWKDRALAVRFALDGIHLDVLISDPNSYYPVEVNLDERSRGFKWFFSFYITFAADTKGGDADGAVLLLDEPGLYLHALSQEDLLKHFQTDFKNQIIYTTHSPFMVPANNIASVRTVGIAPKEGTTVTTNPTGDSRTLFPLQAALGYHISQTLFIGNDNLVVEGITDFWILSSVNSHITSGGDTGLPTDLVIMPVGGASKVHYMAALLASQDLNVLGPVYKVA